MSSNHNLKIVSELGELVYRQVSDLNLSFSRIVDDFTDVANRFGDFSYDFNLPIVKQNSLIFGAPETKGSKQVFLKNRNINCKVYNNNQLILDGLINLEGITDNTYKCKFYSKFKELVDKLNERTSEGDEKTLKDLQFPLVEDWNYEESIINHVNANYKNSDETNHQYPTSFYSTFYCSSELLSGYSGYYYSSLISEKNCFYTTYNTLEYIFPTSYEYNRVLHHQIPPAIYLVSIVEQILKDAGWSLGGQFFNQDNIKKIIYLFNGENDIYDQATTYIQGSEKVDLQLAKFLPEMSQSEFLKGIINMFNLYFRIDTDNRILELETYDTYFRNTDDVQPYNIDDLIDSGPPIQTTYFVNNNPTIRFKKAGNRNVLGNNIIYSGWTSSFDEKFYFQNNPFTISSKFFNQVFNRVGYTEDSNVNLNQYVSTVSTIEIPFAEPTVKHHWIYNDKDKVGDINTSPTYIPLPMLTKQTPTDNNGMDFFKNEGENWVFNNESRIKFQGDGCFMYYYGISESDIRFGDTLSFPILSNSYFTNMYTGTTKFVLPIPIVSPFQLSDNRATLEDWLTGITRYDETIDRRTVIANYLYPLNTAMSFYSGVTPTDKTEYSLVFDDNGYFHETLWSKFHKYKWDRYQNSELVEANLRMNSYDWDQLQINRPILYKDEIYSLVSLEGFNPITEKAKIRMIKKL